MRISFTRLFSPDIVDTLIVGLSALALAGCAVAPPEPVQPPPGFAANPGGYRQEPSGYYQGTGPGYPGGPAYQGAPPGYAYQGPPPGYQGAPPYQGGPAAYQGPPPGYGGPGPAAGAGPMAGPITRAQFLERARNWALRTGHDPERVAAAASRRFEVMDSNHDGMLEPAERAAWRAAHPGLAQAQQRGSQPPTQGSGAIGPQGQWQPPPGRGPGAAGPQGPWQAPPGSEMQ